MLHLNTSEERVSASPEKVYAVLTRFFEKQPEGLPGVSSWESLPNGCCFTIQNQISCKLTLADQMPNSRVTYRAESDKGISADVAFDIIPAGDESILKGQLDMNVPLLLQGMVKGLIGKFLDPAMKQLKNVIEKS